MLIFIHFLKTRTGLYVNLQGNSNYPVYNYIIFVYYPVCNNDLRTETYFQLQKSMQNQIQLLRRVVALQ